MMPCVCSSLYFQFAKKVCDATVATVSMNIFPSVTTGYLWQNTIKKHNHAVPVTMKSLEVQQFNGNNGEERKRTCHALQPMLSEYKDCLHVCMNTYRTTKCAALVLTVKER